MPLLHGDPFTGLERRLRSLSLEQKVRLLTGADSWSLPPEPDAGLRELVLSDGPAGVRGRTWDERDPSANIPSPTALAATWDLDRIERIGRLLAEEARRKRVDVLLAPTVNLQRTPYGGRHFECLSEDPLLTGLAGAAFVRGVQAGGVAATVKHFVANDSETDRFGYDARIDERVLREVYLLPFEIIVRDAGVWAVMAAYNGVNGTTMTASPLLRDVLKDGWSFDGLVMSDWHAARSVAAAGMGLLDLVMPGPGGPWGDALVDAVRGGEVPESAVDDKVVRLLQLAGRVGALDGATSDEPSAPWEPTEVAAELRATAAAGFVLARNDGSVLPLDAARLRRVAVLGPNAAEARTLGGGSATVFPPYAVSPLEGLRDAVGDDVRIDHSVGVLADDRVPVAAVELLGLPDGTGAGLEVRFYDRAGDLLAAEHRYGAHLIWSGAVTADVAVGDVAAVELRARLRAPRTGDYLVGGSGIGTFRVDVDGTTVAEADAALPRGADVVEGMMRPPQVTTAVRLAEGDEAELVVRHEPARLRGSFGEADAATLSVQLNVGRAIDDEAELEHAVVLAAGADVAVVVVGTTEEVESEGFDRTTLALPGRQDELVRRVAGVNPRTIVVVNAGAPVLLPWAEDVAAVLLAWFPGQEFGNALADVLLGAVEPGGRLPTTWPLTEDDHPSVVPVDGRLGYDEGLFVGYRRYDRDGRTPRYAFGHGLGYTDWTYGPVEAPPLVEADEEVQIRVPVRNTGDRPGREVVQVYASRPDSDVVRPPRWLAGFTLVSASPGETVEAVVSVPARAFQHWEKDRGWAVEAGEFSLTVGRSVADRRGSALLRVGSEW